MKEIHKRRIHSINQFLNQPITVIITLVLLFIYFAVGNHDFQAQNRLLLESANRNTKSTNLLVKGQTDILNAIDKTSKDGKLDNSEKTNIIICMLQVPVAQRTTDLQKSCREQVESNPVLDSLAAPGSTTTTPAAGNPGNSQSTAAVPGTQPNPAQASPSPATPRPDNDGIIIDLPLLPRIHIPSPL